MAAGILRCPPEFGREGRRLMPLHGRGTPGGRNARGLRVLFNIMLNLILSPYSIYALSILYLYSIYAWAMESMTIECCEFLPLAPRIYGNPLSG